MKNIYLVIGAMLISSFIYAQEQTEKKEPLIKFSGYIAYGAFSETYKSVDTREGAIYLYPKSQNLDVNGDDLNKVNQYEALSLDTRVRASINGPKAFGAKISGLIEVDWLGTGAAYTHMPRLRHAFVKASWTKVNILMGQYWHPIFTPECFPGTISFGAGLPFNPLNRTPQARLTIIPIEKLEIFVAAASYGYHNFSTPDVLNAQRNAGIPDIHAQVMFKSKVITTGIVSGIKALKPRLETDAGIKTTKTSMSYDIKGFIKVNPIEALSLKASAIYGQNLTPYVMIGGYGAKEDPTLTDDYSYANLNTIALWFDADINIKAVKIGFFAGYSANLGSNTTYITLQKAARNDNLDNIFRISPRVTYTSGKVALSLEYMLTGATYGNTFNDKHKVTGKDDMVANHRIMFSTVYTF